jgi:hypothetical protein
MLRALRKPLPPGHLRAAVRAISLRGLRPSGGLIPYILDVQSNSLGPEQRGNAPRARGSSTFRKLRLNVRYKQIA